MVADPAVTQVYTRSMPAYRDLPKALLHDHLDGGVRVATIIELAAEAGVELPATGSEELAAWFHQGESGSLEKYLEAFDVVLHVMQTEDALTRIAEEAVVDYAADGIVYAEVRFGPMLHRAGGLDPQRAVDAVLAGLHSGAEATGVSVHLILTAMRQFPHAERVAALAARFRANGVVGFDMAGPEAGYPCDAHAEAVTTADDHALQRTIHAGEGDGPNSIYRALYRCGAHRIGHGVRIIEAVEVRDGAIMDLDPIAATIRDRRIPLEVCVTSNIHTGIATSVKDHPIGMLYRAGFAVTLNTDNRLMSDVTLTSEFQAVAEAHDLTVQDLGAMTETALLAGFGPWPVRRTLINDVVRPAYVAG